ncbi:MAG: hypothetical protein K6U09_09255 [Acidobacteriia bacterium]|jgi:hypothetical protein|nr:hypothetical protein [Terriglobia bacterium]
MFGTVRCLLVAILVTGLVQTPLHASAARVLGVVVQGKNAQLNRAAVAGGTTVFAGDLLTTESEGLLRLRLGTSQLYLLENSAARLIAESGRLLVAVERGSLGFSLTDPAPVAVQFDDTLVRPASTGGVHGRLSALGPGEIVVSSLHGTLEVVSGSERFLVSEGSAYRILIEQEPEGVGKADARRRRILTILAGTLALGALTGLILYHALRSPDAP